MALKRPSPTTPAEDPQQYVIKKNYPKAIELYRIQVKNSPGDPQLILRLADCLVLAGQTGAAVSEYKRAAGLYGEQGFLLKAIGVNKKIVKLDPSQEEVHQSLSKLYEERGLLASPATGSRSADSSGEGAAGEGRSGGAGSRGRGGFQFDMEEAADGGGLDIGIGLGGAESIAEAEGLDSPPSAGAEPEHEHEVSAGDVDFGAAGIESGPSPGSGSGFSSEPAAEDSSGSGRIDWSPVSTAAMPTGELSALSELPAPELSVDALGDALSEMSSESGVFATLGALGSELSPEDALDAGAPASVEQLAPDKVPLFSDFTPPEFVEIVRQMEQRSFATDEVVVREGDPGDALFVLVTGSVRVMTNMKGREIKLADLKEGDFFGEGSLITGKPRTATVIANEDAELLSLDRAALTQILVHHPRVMEVMKQFYQQRAESTVRSILKSGKK